MATEKSWVNAVRADALAKIVLTRHEGLDVIPLDRYTMGRDFDLLARFSGKSPSNITEFAVEVVGVRRQFARTRRALSVEIDPARIEQATLPVLLVVFDVDDEEGFFAWLSEPVVSPDGTADLRPNRALSRQSEIDHLLAVSWSVLSRLDDLAVAKIVHRVADWYAKRDCPSPSAETGLIRV